MLMAHARRAPLPTGRQARTMKNVFYFCAVTLCAMLFSERNNSRQRGTVTHENKGINGMDMAQWEFVLG